MTEDERAALGIPIRPTAAARGARHDPSLAGRDERLTAALEAFQRVSEGFMGFNEYDHPRDELGRFAKKRGGNLYKSMNRRTEIATGAAIGAVIGLPFAGVGAIPGAAAGAIGGEIAYREARNRAAKLNRGLEDAYTAGRERKALKFDTKFDDPWQAIQYASELDGAHNTGRKERREHAKRRPRATGLKRTINDTVAGVHAGSQRSYLKQARNAPGRASLRKANRVTGGRARDIGVTGGKVGRDRSYVDSNGKRHTTAAPSYAEVRAASREANRARRKRVRESFIDSLHPRDELGRFARKAGAGMRRAGRKIEGSARRGRLKTGAQFAAGAALGGIGGAAHLGMGLGLAGSSAISAGYAGILGGSAVAERNARRKAQASKAKRKRKPEGNIPFTAGMGVGYGAAALGGLALMAATRGKFRGVGPAAYRASRKLDPIRMRRATRAARKAAGPNVWVAPKGSYRPYVPQNRGNLLTRETSLERAMDNFNRITESAAW